MNHIEYAERYFRGKKCVTKSWDESRAKRAHETGENYVAVVHRDGRPYCFLEIAKEFVGIGYLDHLLREVRCLAFVELEPGRVFLNRLIEREFQGDSDNLKSAKVLYFEADGTTRKEEVDMLKKEQVIGTSQNPLDVSWHWERFPEFGQYDSIIGLMDRYMERTSSTHQ